MKLSLDPDVLHCYPCCELCFNSLSLINTWGAKKFNDLNIPKVMSFTITFSDLAIPSTYDFSVASLIGK